MLSLLLFSACMCVLLDLHSNQWNQWWWQELQHLSEHSRLWSNRGLITSCNHWTVHEPKSPHQEDQVLWAKRCKMVHYCGVIITLWVFHSYTLDSHNWGPCPLNIQRSFAWIRKKKVSAKESRELGPGSANFSCNVKI